MGNDQNPRQTPHESRPVHQAIETGTLNFLSEQLEKYKLIFDSIYNGIMVTDSGYLDHIAFRGSGLADMRARLERQGVEYRSSYIEESNMTQLFFHDPSGTKLEINFPGET